MLTQLRRGKMPRLTNELTTDWMESKIAFVMGVTLKMYQHLDKIRALVTVARPKTDRLRLACEAAMVVIDPIKDEKKVSRWVMDWISG